MAKTPKSDKRRIGNWGERQAAIFLEEKGYQILHRNVRTPYGEIDLIAQHDSVIVFVEVKTRTTGKFGNPEEAVTGSKMTHMIESAESYLQENPDIKLDWRIDVIAVMRTPGEKPEIVHFENSVS